MKEWTREYFKEGGGEAFLFYVLFGNFDQHKPALSREEYSTEGFPDGLDVMQYSRSNQSEVLEGFCEGYLWETLKSENPDLSKQVLDSDECLIFRGHLIEQSSLNYFRDAVGVMTYFFDHGGACLYDPFMFKWWTKDEWQSKVFKEEEFSVFEHTTILFSQEEDGLWYHTRGMRKFGRPDLSIRGVDGASKDAAVEVIQRFMKFQAQGGIVDEGSEVKVSGFPEGYKCYHAGDIEDPDFNNVHIEIRWGQ